eukprot:scpid99111/ scgid31311/ COMM domain-containing protein 3; Protein Bup; Protein PIL
MEISSSVSLGLQACGDSTHVPDAAFKDLVGVVFDVLLQQKDESAIEGSSSLSGLDQGVLKEAYASMCTFTLQAAQHDTDVVNLTSVLEECKLTSDRCQVYTDRYAAKKTDLRAMLSSTATRHPHVVDVDWRLDYYIKNNHVEKVNTPVYLVNLKTQACGQSGTSDVQFACSVEQLQDLVGKLKDAVKGMDKLATS